MTITYDADGHPVFAPQFGSQILPDAQQDVPSPHPAHDSFNSEHNLKDGKPHGGNAIGIGFEILWQKGPLGRGDDRIAQNGAFVETITGAVIDRLCFYESTQFSCPENRRAISHLQAALRVMQSRTKRREEAGTEGTHEGN